MKTPMLPVCLAFAVGIAIADNFLSASMAWWSLGVTLIITLPQLFLLFKKNPTALSLRLIPVSSLILPLLSVCLCGMTSALIKQVSQTVDYPSDYDSYDVIVISEPQTRSKTIVADVTITSGKYRGYNVRMTFDKSCLNNGNINIGDGMEVRCKLNKPKNFNNSNFSYSRYLQTRDILFVTFVGKSHCRGKVLSYDDLPFLQRIQLGAMRFRHKLLERYRQLGLTGEGLAIAAAMTLGDKSLLSETLKDTYSISGASHILALSGTHLVIVFFLISLLFGRRAKHWYGRGATLALIWTYVIIVGMPSSVVRSALMLTIFNIAQTAGRGKNSINSLATTATIMLTFNPLSLFDIGFQLSILAVASIVLTSQHLPHPKRFPYHSKIYYYTFYSLSRIMPFVVIPIAAQLATAPLVAYYFGRIPVYFILSNIVIIPATSIILYLSAGCLALSFIPLLGSWCAWLLQQTIEILNQSLTFVVSLPHSSIPVERMSIMDVTFCYCLLIILIAYLQLNQRKYVNNNKVNGIY
ncbi:MAG: ComEC/Rec2 family competence protein [Prevotella sp.]